MLLVDLNYNFECDWFVELSDKKLSDNNLASELVGNRSFFKPITIEEIVIFMIIIVITITVIIIIIITIKKDMKIFLKALRALFLGNSSQSPEY